MEAQGIEPWHHRRAVCEILLRNSLCPQWEGSDSNGCGPAIPSAQTLSPVSPSPLGQLGVPSRVSIQLSKNPCSHQGLCDIWYLPARFPRRHMCTCPSDLHCSGSNGCRSESRRYPSHGHTVLFLLFACRTSANECAAACLGPDDPICSKEYPVHACQLLSAKPAFWQATPPYVHLPSWTTISGNTRNIHSTN